MGLISYLKILSNLTTIKIIKRVVYEMLLCTVSGFLLAILINFFNHFITLAQESRQKSELKFGPKIEWHPFLASGFRSLSIGQTYRIGLWGEYILSKVPGVFSNPGLEIGLFYLFVHHMYISERDIDPLLKSTPLVGCCCAEPSSLLKLKSLAIPITSKFYYGKRNKFCFSWGFSIAYLLTATKEKDDSHYTSLSIKNIFPSRWCLGTNVGIQYEINIGLVLGCTMLYEYVGMKIITLGPTFTLGYNLNKLLKWSPNKY